MQYEWDKAKNRGNIAKHGIDFADAVAVLEDALAITRPDPDSREEARNITLGMDGLGRLLVVVHAERQSRIRIISARTATRKERNDYES